MTLIPVSCFAPCRESGSLLCLRVALDGSSRPVGAVSTVILNTLLPPRRKHLKIRENWPLGLIPFPSQLPLY